MSNKSIEKILAFVGLFLIITLIVQFIKELNKKTETKVISEKGLAALSNPVKKKEIDKAIESAKSEHEKTRVWQDPEIVL